MPMTERTRVDYLAIEPGRVSRYEELLALRARRGRAEEDDFSVAAMADQQVGVSNRIAVIAIDEIIMDRPGWGGIDCQRCGAIFDQLVANEEVGAIVLDVASPGGMVYGTPELAAKIAAARGAKPIVAVANQYAFSAAYWIASAASELVVSPSGEVGSIGVIATHVDVSQSLESEGIKVTLIRSVKYKQEGNMFEPLSEAAQAEIQRIVDAYHQQFIKAVAKNRGVTVTQANKQFGQGRTFLAADAVAAGLADRVATMEDTLLRLSKKMQSAAARRRAQKQIAFANQRRGKKT